MITRLVVCGGRDFADEAVLAAALDRFLAEHEAVEFVTGHAPGADALAEKYASEHGIPNKIIPADWQQYGRSAGPIRNRQMLDYAAEAEPAVLAFWDGKSRGTRHTIETAKTMGIAVDVVRY